MDAKSGKTILLVDNHQPVRNSVGELLRLRGYNVLLAATGDEALEIVSKSEDPIDLLITDVNQPKINGLELAQHLLQQQPKIKILVMTAYSEQIAFQNFEHLRDTMDFIQKPCSMDALLQKIRSLLNEEIDSA